MKNTIIKSGYPHFHELYILRLLFYLYYTRVKRTGCDNHLPNAEGTKFMELRIAKSYLSQGIQIVSKAVPSKTTMSILECILIDASGSDIRLIGY